MKYSAAAVVSQLKTQLTLLFVCIANISTFKKRKVRICKGFWTSLIPKHANTTDTKLDLGKEN